MNQALGTLQTIRDFAGTRQTVGLDDATIERFLDLDPNLANAIADAGRIHKALQAEYGELLAGDESDAAAFLQSDFVNFYPANTVNPYISMAAAGPWIITSHGAVLHDNGGYGMLGAGHSPRAIMDIMGDTHVMANVMTPNFTHKRFATLLKAEVGQTRGSCPFSKFICMNSGSESVTVAFRIADVNAKHHTEPSGPRAGAAIKILSLSGSFHGRTDRPAQASDSCLGKYKTHLASHAANNNLITVPPNDVEALRKAFAQAEADGVFIELMLIEPVMGEGDPGLACSREFYDAARALTKAHGSLLLVDSIQAGLRGSGYLSIIDYPGFQTAEEPDLETYSKALNAGQYPLSVLACNERAANLYVRGIYGNTMTTNPRALAVGCAVLEALTPELRANIQDRGQDFLDGLNGLMEGMPELVLKVQGTGLLFSAELHPAIEVVGFEGIETWLRKNGLGVIHGGENSLRFTPHFAITKAEVDLIIHLVRDAILAFSDLVTDSPAQAASK
ncbi:MAG: aminotransferase class III-fold pyridoxal phosphate-dependent enzyme [Myxococcota bacterium]|nr:aminotransferase class III-fold pyridoxal phosphate-dependent enzyme [Myxococcota bacterium]